MMEYYDLGTYTRAISTDSYNTRRCFNRGLIWTCGYNHEEAIVCFEKALECDQDCATAHWGIAMQLVRTITNPDLTALFAEAIMNRTPWQLWDPATGKPAAGADSAEAVQTLESAFDRVPESRMLFNNTCRDILRIAEQMLHGELAYHQGHHSRALDHLRQAVSLDDTLPYDEPWAWMQPARHALGALLLEQG